MKAVNIKIEHLKNPLGLDIQKPIIRWCCEGGTLQSAYRVIAVSNGSTVWDSGKVGSSDMHVTYPLPLVSRQRVELSITLWDENGAEGNKSEAFFEMSLLTAEDLLAKWISGDYKPRAGRRYPVDCFKREFCAEDILCARLYATACGVYEARINGKRVGDFILAPGYTDYRRRVQLNAYDVTALLTDGANVIEAELADGWYRGSCGAWGLKNQYGRRTKLLLQLEITHRDGTVTTIVTDDSWQWSNDGPIRFADNQDGEVVDASLTPSYSDRVRVTRHGVIPRASNNVPVTEHESFKPTIIKTPKGATVLNFGQNIAGYIAFKVKARAGQKIKLRFGETFDKDGEFTQTNIQCANKKRTKVTPLQEITYITKEGVNEYKTKFAVFGFQYALIETDVDFTPEDFTAIAVYSDMQETLRFSCSNELINKFVESTRWSSKNNHLDVPTDCPTRERHGWTGDAQIFCDTASYLFDYAAFARKYACDMRDGQKKNGVFRQITPSGGTDFYMSPMDGSAGWSDAGVLIPYRIFKRYADRSILEENYGAMRKYAIFKINTLGKHYPTGMPTGLSRKHRKMISNYGQSYGEWAEPADVNPFKITDFICPHPEETTAYLAYMLDVMAEIAEILGKSEDKLLFEKHRDIAKEGYGHLVKAEKFSLDTERQSKLVRPLYLGLLDEEQTKYAKKRLLSALDNYAWRLGTGFLSTPFILYVLADIDIEHAYRLLENEEMPGWLFMPKMGANTIWESWEGTEAKGGVASLNHYSKGAVCEWVFSVMCGIKVDTDRCFTVEPKIGGSITHAECEYDSVYGTVRSAWQRTKDGVRYEITVPPNTSLRFILGGEERLLSPGRHEITV